MRRKHVLFLLTVALAIAILYLALTKESIAVLFWSVLVGQPMPALAANATGNATTSAPAVDATGGDASLSEAPGEGPRGGGGPPAGGSEEAVPEKCPEFTNMAITQLTNGKFAGNQGPEEVDGWHLEGAIPCSLSDDGRYYCQATAIRSAQPVPETKILTIILTTDSQYIGTVC